VVLLALVAGSAIASFVAFRQAERQAHAAGRDRVERAGVALDRMFASTAASLEGIRGLFNASHEVTADEFRRFAGPIVREGTLSAVSFIAHVTASGRAAYERGTGRPIIEPGPRETQVARARADHYPVRYLVASRAGGARLMNFDLGADEARRAALESARDTGRVTASGPVPLYGDGTLAALLYEPIYAQGRPVRTVSERRSALIGFATSSLRISRLGSTVVAQMPAGTEIRIFEGDRQLYGPADDMRHGHSRPVAVGGRQWTLVASEPSAEWGLPAVILGGGLALSLCVGLLMWQAIRREGYALGLVDARLRDQRAVEATLRERESQLAEAQRTAHIGSWEWDVARDEIWWSPELCRLFGVPTDGFARSFAAYLARIHPEDRPMAAGLVRETLRTGEPFSFYHRVVHADGAVRTLHGRGRVERDAAGAVTRMLGTAQDVTEARAAEEELRRQRDYAAGLVDAMQDGLLVLSGDGAIVEASPSFCGLTGFSRDELLGTCLPFPYWPAGTQTQLDRAFAHLAAEGSCEWDLRFRHRNGTDIPVILSASVLRGADGAVLGYPATVKDVTGRAAVQRLKDEFVALASHELRTPLSSVLGYMELILDDTPSLNALTSQQRRFLEVVDRNAKKLQRLVGDLLLIGRADAGRLALDLAEVDLAALARECAESARPRAEGHGLALHVDVDGVPPCRADRARVGQVIDNLLSNALKFTPPGGRVDVRVAAGTGTVLVEVSDTGIGISASEQGRLFERFYRTAAAESGAIPGTGLGLAISKMIVEAHGGTIWVESDEGRGARFSLVLPLADRAPVTGAGRPLSGASAGPAAAGRAGSSSTSG
jgi:PAS domain S-box-containing protein